VDYKKNRTGKMGGAEIVLRDRRVAIRQVAIEIWKLQINKSNEKRPALPNLG
jgi:hypothetical protein